MAGIEHNCRSKNFPFEQGKQNGRKKHIDVVFFALVIFPLLGLWKNGDESWKHLKKKT